MRLSIRQWAFLAFCGLIGISAAALLPWPAHSQSSPGLVYGQVPTAAQWNSYFMAKQDWLGYRPVSIGGDIMQGELRMAPSSTTSAGINLQVGNAPTSPVDGDMWTTTAGLYVQINGSTIGPLIDHATIPGDVAYLDQPQSFTKAQRTTPITVSISGSTFTPNFDNSQNFTITLVHASCPCTIANPSTTLAPGQAGVINIIQSSTGSDTVSWGSSYIAAGGVATIALSTAGNAKDYLSYYVDASSNIVISMGAANATH